MLKVVNNNNKDLTEDYYLNFGIFNLHITVYKPLYADEGKLSFCDV